MIRDELLQAIEDGKLTADMLFRIFDDSVQIAEDLRLKALARMIRTDPKGARPFFKRLDTDKLADAIHKNRLEPSLIALAVRAFPDSSGLANAVLKNPRSPSRALLVMSERATQAQLNELLRDELKLILNPDVARKLYRSSRIDDQQRIRLKELLDKMKSDKQYRIREEMRPEGLSRTDANLMLLEKEAKEELEKAESKTKKRENIYTRLMHMTAAEKALLALHGNREVRMILARDRNRMVARAVMRSPRTSETDIVSISQMREVDEEVLRIISRNRLWMRSYTIVKNLTFNPRSPISIVISLLERLSNMDIRLASRDHNLTNVVKKAAGRIARKRGLI